MLQTNDNQITRKLDNQNFSYLATLSSVAAHVRDDAGRPESRDQVTRHVLGKFKPAEQRELQNTIFDKAVDMLEKIEPRR